MKKSFKTKQVATKKLFYKKWLFKIVLECGGISYLHRKGIDYIKEVTVTDGYGTWARMSMQSIVNNRASLLRIASILELILPTADHQIRVESSSCSIFTNDENMLDQINARLSEFVTEIHKPANKEQAEYLLTNKNKVICNELPLEGYRYRVYFKNVEMKNGSMSNFLKWADNYNDGRIHLPNGIRKILSGDTHPYLYGQYFYVKDQKTASMALMVMGEYLNRTEEFVLKSEVNA